MIYVFGLVYLLIGLFIFAIIEGMQLVENSPWVMLAWPLIIALGILMFIIWVITKLGNLIGEIIGDILG